MELKKALTMMWRCGITASILTAAFWTIWRLVAGSVPATTADKLLFHWPPIGAVSRWWDVPAAFGIVALIVLVVTFFDLEPGFDALISVLLPLMVGAAVSLLDCLLVIFPAHAYAAFMIAAFGLLTSLISIMLVSYFSGPDDVWIRGLAAGLCYVAGLCLGIGLAVGLLYGFVLCFAFVLAVALVALACLVLGNKDFWRKVGNWFLAEDTWHG